MSGGSGASQGEEARNPAADRLSPENSPRFYGRRSAWRLRPGRRALLATLLPRLAVTVPEGDDVCLDPDALFHMRPGAVWMEIGFGAGEHLLQQAAHHPHVGFIGCEPFLNGVAALVAGLAERRLDNVRVFSDDARLLLPRLPAGSIGRIFLLFPDPWPKRRHHRRRFLAGATLDQLARVLVDGGEFRFASDHAEYAATTAACIEEHPAFTLISGEPADERVTTRYEAKAQRSGLRPIHLCAVRRSLPENRRLSRKTLV